MKQRMAVQETYKRKGFYLVSSTWDKWRFEAAGYILCPIEIISITNKLRWNLDLLITCFWQTPFQPRFVNYIKRRMSSNCASESDVDFDLTQRKLEEEKDHQMALSLWRTDVKAAAVRARKLRRRNFSRRDGSRLLLSSSKKKSFKQPRTSKLSSE